MTTTPDLLNVALDYARTGLSLVPCSSKTKKPDNDLLPSGPDGKPTWLPFQETPADEATIRRWFARGCQCVAAVGGKASGGLLVIDFDEARFYDAWRPLVGNLADGLAIQRTGREGGGYQVWLRCPEPGRNDKLAYRPDAASDDGRTIAIETRAQGGYAVAPGSLHPSGRRYAVVAGDFASIPTVPQAVADALLQAARKLCEAPVGRKALERQAAAETCPKYKATANGQGSVIDLFNERHGIEDMLKAAGYRGQGQRWIRPGGKSLSVFVEGGRSFHHSSNDPLSNGYWRRPFDVFAELEHGGDCRAAVKAAAEALGLASGTHKTLAAVNGTPSKHGRNRGFVDVDNLWRPFPTDALPEILRDLVRQGARSLCCDEAFIALPSIVVCGAAIGMARVLSLKDDWRALPTLWGAVVADSGSSKSPSLKMVLGPVWDLESSELDLHSERMQDYERDLLVHKKAMSQWEKEKGSSSLPPSKPEPPVCNRFVIGDATVEALAPLLSSNPKGLLNARDELSSWLGAFGRYNDSKAAKEASDWIELYNAGTIIVDRKHGDRRTIHVRNAVTSIIGGIQPSVLHRAIGTEHRENGLLARFLLVAPPRVPKKWNDTSVSPMVKGQFRNLIGALKELQLSEDEHGNGVPVCVKLTDEAHSLFQEHYNRHAQEQADATGDWAAALSKLEENPGRLALILHMVRLASRETNSELVDAESMQNALTLYRWFKGETARVYAMLDETDEQADTRRLVEWIARHGGNVTPRDVQAGCRWLRAPGEAEAALDALVKCGAARWQFSDSTPQGGRPTAKLVLLGVSVNETPKTLAIPMGSVDTPQRFAPEPSDLDDANARLLEIEE